MTNPIAQTLEQHFDVAFTAPNGIKKLRELILTLAMQGKLVPQDPNDTPASELLKDIANEKARLVSEGKIKKQKPLPAIPDDEKPYDLPQGWEWVRLGDYCKIFSGNAFKSEDFNEVDGVKAIKITNAGVGELIETQDYLPKEYSTLYPDFVVRENDLILALTRPYISAGLKISVCPKSYDGSLLNQRVASIRSYFFPKYVYLFLSSPKVLNIYQDRFRDAGLQPNLKISDVTDLIIQIPPLAEQHRIVAKIDQLMARCDALEALQQAKEAQRLSVHQAAIRQLLDAEHTHTAWQFLQTHFAELYSVKANVSELRKAILQLAVMGKLVPQDPNDTPASELLKEIASEKARLVSEGKIKKQKPLPAISDDEKPYDLPQGWEWVRLNAVFNTTSGNTFDAAMEKDVGAFAYIKVGDMNLAGNERQITTSSRFVDPDEKMSRSLIPTGSIIFPKRGGAIATNKKRIVVNPIFVDLNTMAITPNQGIETEYAYLWLLTIDLASLNTGTSVPQINHQDIDPLPFSLPPLSEQQRIVAKIEQLMSLCDNLEQQIDVSQAKQSKLLAAVMSGV